MMKLREDVSLKRLKNTDVNVQVHVESEHASFFIIKVPSYFVMWKFQEI